MVIKINSVRTCGRILAALLMVFASTSARADLAKLDAELRREMETRAAEELNPGTLASSQVAVTVQFSGDGLAAMKARGVVVRSVLGDVATVLMPIDRLAEIAALPEVHRLESVRRAVPRPDNKLSQ